MPERERVKQAIEAPVAEAAKLLEESHGADVETRLTILIDGWCRGLAAGIEELAISVAELRRAASPEEPPAPPQPIQPPSADRSHEPRENEETSDARSEDELRADATRSREATRALREQAPDHQS